MSFATDTSSEKKDETSKSENIDSIDIVLEDNWMIRDCEIYKDEYNECTSYRGRFHQYFIYGHTLDCNQWKRDYNNCSKWIDTKDLKAAQSLIDSERNRRMERLKAHYGNNTWKQRTFPPADWDKPLPEWITKRDENTYLAQKAKEIKEGKIEDDKNSFCSIM